MIILLSILIGVLGVIAWSFMDEVDHRWSRWFKYIAPPGSKAEAYLNPRVSWPRKKNKNRFIEFILETLLVMFTDFWHLMKFVVLSCIFAVVILIGGYKWEIIIFMHLSYGFVFEIFFRGVFGELGTRLKYKNDGKSKGISE